MDKDITIDMLKKEVEKFTKDRDWQKFHTPKNLSMNIAIEAAELMEIFLWYDPKDCEKELEKRREEVENEVADIARAVIDFCIFCNIDLSNAIKKKMILAAEKYPIEKCKGKNLKYNQL